MKKTLSALVAILSVLPFLANAQWVQVGNDIHNINTGSVGIGTSSPANTLEVQNPASGWLMNLRTNAVSVGDINGLKFYSGYLGENKWSGISSISEDINSNHTALALYSNANERLRISAAGNVGIGTSSPATTLEVQNPTGGWLMNLRTYAGSPGNLNGLKFYSGYIGDDKWSGISSIAEDINSNHTALALYSNQDERVRIAANGNVGVGTHDPSQKLTVSTYGNGSSVTPMLRLEQYNAGSPVNGTGVSIDMAIGDNTNLPALAGQIKLVRSDYINTSMYFSTAFNNTLTDRMVINPFGSVGIGTLTPDAKLSVNGDIHTQEVRVDMTGWSDYVFKPTYHLPPLSEVKTYIDQNQHLSEMPSEQEVIKNGINLGEMNKLLLKKVEELTLYLIEQNKQLQDNKKENKALRQDLENLKQEVHKN